MISERRFEVSRLLEMQYKSIRVNLHHFIGEMMQMPDFDRSIR